MTQLLSPAYRFHKRAAVARWRPTRDGLKSIPFAVASIAKARADVRNGTPRYTDSVWIKPFPAAIRQRDGMTYVEDPSAAGLRLVGNVRPEFRHGRTWSNDATGWFTDPFGNAFKDGSGLCWGVVYQLPGKSGKARFVAGYQMGGTDGGPVLDLGTIYRPRGGDVGEYPRDMDCAFDAARVADSMAEKAAEREKDYQAAWQAGSQFAQLEADISTERRELLQVLRERREFKSETGYPALCRAIRATVRHSLGRIAKWRADAAQLAAGEHDRLPFYPADETLKDAFNEGAGRSVLA